MCTPLRTPWACWLRRGRAALWAAVMQQLAVGWGAAVGVVMAAPPQVALQRQWQQQQQQQQQPQLLACGIEGAGASVRAATPVPWGLPAAACQMQSLAWAAAPLQPQQPQQPLSPSPAAASPLPMARPWRMGPSLLAAGTAPCPLPAAAVGSTPAACTQPAWWTCLSCRQMAMSQSRAGAWAM